MFEYALKMNGYLKDLEAIMFHTIGYLYVLQGFQLLHQITHMLNLNSVTNMKYHVLGNTSVLNVKI